MVENNTDIGGSLSQNNDAGNTASEYLNRAAQACATGDAVLGMHLYLAAFERATHGSRTPDLAAVDGLRQAWRLACRLKERSLAEYIFERLEPYLRPDEVAQCAEQLQRLALDKLEEFGLSREDLEDMTEMITQDFFGFPHASFFMQVEHREPEPPAFSMARRGGQKGQQAPTRRQPAERTLTESTLRQGEGGVVETTERLTYADIVGYRGAIETMHRFGIGMQDDAEFQELVEMLNVRHGLDRTPIIDTYVFRAPVREDANQFMTATLGEIGLPAVRMRMEENMQGLPVLCVMAQADNRPHLGAGRTSFEDAAVLVLEDIDLWGSPFPDDSDDDFFPFGQLSRGAREAMDLIRSAVENPDVYVLASAGGDGQIDGFFYDLLDPVTTVEIDNPTPAERADLWIRIASEHPSLRAIDTSALVHYSAGMSRYDICMAAREAVEDAYKESLLARRYIPVTEPAMLEKLAAYQPLDSQEYRQLEDAVAREFRAEIERLEGTLGEE